MTALDVAFLNRTAVVREMEKLAELTALLDEALRHALQYDSHCKSSENAISLDFGHYWNRNPDGGIGLLGAPAVSIYSYVLNLKGGGRQHFYDSIDEALADVRRAHREEMEHDYSEDNW